MLPVMRCHSYASCLYACHISTRLLFGSGLLFLATTTSSAWLAVLMSGLAAVMLRLLSADWQLCWRVLRLLRWFMVPILVLHALFTPGRLLLPGMVPLLSMEGLMQGLWLSVHLMSIYATALLMFRLLSRREWLTLLAQWPWGGEVLAMRLWMVLAMQGHIFALLAGLREQFHLRHDWRKSAQLLINAFRQSLQTATDQAGLLWLRWPQHGQALHIAYDGNTAPVSTVQRATYSVFLLAGGCVALLVPWLV